MKRFNYKRWLSLLLAAAMIISYLPGHVHAAGNENLAYGKTVTVSNTENDNYVGSNIVDGDRSADSHWGTAQGKAAGEWAEIDLGEATPIKQIDIYFERSDADQNILSFKVEIYASGAYETVYTKNARASQLESIVLQEPKQAEKVKITVLEADGGSMGWVNVGISEVEIFGAGYVDPSDASRDIPLHALTVSAGDCETAGGSTEGPAELVLDQYESTLWHTDWHGTSRENHWIQFMLSEEYLVDGLRYLPRQSGGSNGTILDYDIQVSNDGSEFNTVTSGTWANNQNWKIATFNGVQAKYVRLVAKNAVTDNTYVFASAAEIRLTGVAAPAHEHSFVETVATQEYLETPATCSKAATYYYSCKCGEKDTTSSFESGEPLPHNYGAAVFTWDGTSATAAFTCQDDNSHTETVNAAVTSKTTEGGCETGATVVYTATVTMNGTTYTDTKTVTSEGGGHKYVNGFCTVCNEYEEAVEVDGVYQITNGGQLYWFAQLVNTSGNDAVIDAVLVNDIVVNEGTLSAASRAWTPIGYYNKSTDKVYYSGTFDGQGHTISGLYCVRPSNASSGDYIGLFGYVDTNGTVKNVGVLNSEFTGRTSVGGIVGNNYYGTITGCWNASKITGTSNVGGVVGNNAGSISQCYNTGAVTNTSSVGTKTGGVVGCSNEGSVQDCYNTGAVTGQDQLGGIAGMITNGVSVSDCYNTGDVTSTKSGATFNGSVVGWNYTGSTENSIANCYYLADSETDSQDGTTFKTEAQFASGEVAYLLNGSTDEGDLVWKQTLESDTAPVYVGEVVHYNPDAETPYYNGEPEIVHKHNYVNGFCAVADCDAYYEPATLVDGVYRISNGGQLYWFAQLVNGGETDADAILVENITVNENVLVNGALNTEGTFRVWMPMGSLDSGYTGTFDGDEHIISGLYFNDTNAENVGLFGCTAAGALVKDLTLTGSYIAGKANVGGLVGSNAGTIDNCSNGATLTAKGFCLGGIAGYSTGLIDSCSNSGNIIGSNRNIGGVVGKIENATIRNSHNVGVIGPKGTNVGGVVGQASHANVENCYNEGDVDTTGSTSSSTGVGGVVGNLADVSVAVGCYNSGSVTGKTRVGGVFGSVVGTNYDGQSGDSSSISKCYNTGTVTGTSFVGGVAGANDSGSLIDNCYNAGTVDGPSDNSGGVLGLNNFYSTLKNSYNVGTMVNGSGVVGKNENEVINCYYLADSETDSQDGTTFKTEAQFASGEVTYLLNGSTDEGDLVWKQTLESNTAPAYVGEVVHYHADAKPPYYNGEPEFGHKHKYENGFCSGADCDAYYEPAAVVDGVYQISNGGQLYWFAELVNSGNTEADAILLNDIYVNQNVLKADGSVNGDGSNFRTWTPIGTISKSYVGDFDGASCTVSGLYFNDKSTHFVGFIGSADAGFSIKDLTVADSYFCGGQDVGGIVGTTMNSDSISGCVNASSVQGVYEVGGIVGGNYGTDITGCVNMGLITGVSGQTQYDEETTPSCIGGVAGFHSNAGAEITCCANLGEVRAQEGKRVGGVAGNTYANSVIDCYNTAPVSGTQYVGGVVGFAQSSSVVRNCHNTAQISGNSSVGAVAGYRQSNSLLENNYYLADSETDSYNGTTFKTEAQFASGEVTYLLNGTKSDETVVWRQTLTGENVDEIPVFDGEIVYQGYTSCADDAPVVYSNDPNTATEKPDHDWEEATCAAPKTCKVCKATEGTTKDHTYANGFCSVCDAYEPAVLADGVYQISNGGQLYWFAQLVNGGETDADAILMENIIVNENVLVNGALNTEGTFRVWTPIGGNGTSVSDTGVKYTGTFDGNNKTVSGLYFSDADAYYVGLIGYLNEGEVKNVGIIDSYISARQYFAGVVGNATSSTVEGCYNTGYIMAGGSTSKKYSQYFGGVAGMANGGTVISECYNAGTIHLRSYSVNAGGVVGNLTTAKDLETRTKIIDSYNTGSFVCTANASGVAKIGGIAGSSTNGDVERCWNEGNVVATKMDGTGGIVGVDNGSSTILNCYNHGDVNCPAGNAGGIIGKANDKGIIENCYNIGTVTSENSVNAGGIVGNIYYASNGYILNCYYLTGCCTGVNGALTGSANSTEDQEGLTGKTEAQFASGEVTYLLNGSTDEGELVWKQTLESDIAPVFVGEVVHYNPDAETPYYNGEPVIVHKHNYVNGFCSVADCDAYYEPATLVDGVYQISNGGQLYWFAQLVNGGETDADAILVENITVNENVLVNGALNTEGTFRVWTPIGGNGTSVSDTGIKYSGTFDGNNKTISGLYFSDADAYHVGLIGCLNEGEVKNVSLTNSYISGKARVGGIVATAENANVTNCHNASCVTGSSYVGGIVGYIKKGLVTDCSNTGTIIGTGEQVGGIAGGVYGYSTQFKAIVSGCTNDGAVSGKSQVGGVVGHVEYGTVEYSSNSASITAGGTYVGGVVGYFTATSTFNNVVHCFNTGDVSGSGQSAGGVVGSFSGGATSKIENCYNTGNVSNTASLTGGILGRQQTGKVVNCYNTGTVTGTGDYNGGICGNVLKGEKPTNCYYLADTETDALDGTTFKTEAQFASGEVAYLLNGSKVGESVVWRQTLTGENADLTPRFVGEIVYQGYTSCAEDAVPVYSNDPNAAAEKPSHSWVDADCETPKTCSVCNATEGEALGHSYPTTPNSYTNDGETHTEHYVCETDASHTKDVPGVPHDTSNAATSHNCICGATISQCADNDNNHKCDICQEEMSVCTDDDNDHECDICGETVSQCADNDNNHKCDICQKEMSVCVDGDNDHECDICGETISLCADNDNNHKCDICQKEMSVCVDDDNDHECDICGETISLCADNDNNHQCDVCGEIISLCVDDNKDHNCDICGKPIGLCTDGNNDHQCDDCGETISLCIDENNDHNCDICGVAMSVCADNDNNHQCDTCGEIISVCADGDNDHVCDICGVVISICADGDNDHQCDTCGEIISICADGDSDHQCDTCGEIISLCVDDNSDHNCDICGKPIVLCTDGNNDHQCDDCGEIISLCVDDNNDHYCDICGVAITLCEDADGNHKCDTCQKEMSICADGDSNHECDICGETISLCVDADNDHECDICGVIISLCVDDDNDHLCDICGEATSLCVDADNDHLCDNCGKPIVLCSDEDNDHLCDDCGATISLCADDDNDHLCDVCGVAISLCTDNDDNHQCDICGETLSLCADNDDDHLCDICGEAISLCSDTDGDHACDICGETISLCADNNNDHKCDICQKEISVCADGDKDHKCDICDKTLSLCADNDNDHKCDICHKEMSVCTDGDKDHKCDICGETISLCDDSDNDHNCDICGNVISLCTGGQATCAAPANCEICGEPYGEKDPDNHTGKTHVENAKDPTCAVPGFTGDITCECGKIMEEGEQIPATGEHDYRNGTCSVCGGKDPNYTKPSKPVFGGIWDWIFGGWWNQGDKCEHSYTAVVTEPTCTEKGYTTYTCSKCGESCRNDYTNALGHSWDKSEVTKEPTCTENGERIYTCGTCGHQKTETIKATGHNYEDGICGGCGAEKPTEPSVPDKPNKPNKPGWGGIWDWIFGGWWK